MNKLLLLEIRNLFIKYFKDRNHKYHNSYSLISKYDDLLFVNSGMSVFKDMFYNKKSFINIVSNQKCLRVNGKYNDILNTGLSNKHNTFFEMLGNFSFGNYFRNEAIEMAFDFLTNKNYLSLDSKKLIITIYHLDSKSEIIWKKLGIKSYNIIKIKDKNNIKYNSDNFWKISYLGLCGPCTEIYYDFGDKYYGNFPGYGNVGLRYLEIWNIVFIKYNIDKFNNLNKLEYNSIDTGMGLERIVSVIQNINSIFKIDIFNKLINIIKFKLYKNKLSKKFINNIEDSFFNIISDHIRAIIFIINENILPSNKKHGYVLRKIIRRSFCIISSIGIKEPFLYKLINSFIFILIKYYDNNLLCTKNLKNINKIVLNEEISFINVIKKGLILLKRYKLKNYIYKKEIYNIYETYGLPINIIIDYCKNNNIIIKKK